MFVYSFCHISATDTTPVMLTQKAQPSTLGHNCAKFEQKFSQWLQRNSMDKIFVYIICRIIVMDTAPVIISQEIQLASLGNICAKYDNT